MTADRIIVSLDRLLLIEPAMSGKQMNNTSDQKMKMNQRLNENEPEIV